jgi:hypothetical protein
MNHDQCSSPVLPDLCQHNPENPVGAIQPGAFTVALVDGQLPAKREIFEDKCVMASREEPKQAEQTGQEREHVT